MTSNTDPIRRAAERIQHDLGLGPDPKAISNARMESFEAIIRAELAHVVGALRDYVQHIDSMPTTPEKSAHLGMALNNEPGERVRAALAQLEGRDR